MFNFTVSYTANAEPTLPGLPLGTTQVSGLIYLRQPAAGPHLILMGDNGSEPVTAVLTP
jgi:hypothetical protein